MNPHMTTSDPVDGKKVISQVSKKIIFMNFFYMLLTLTFFCFFFFNKKVCFLIMDFTLLLGRKINFIYFL